MKTEDDATAYADAIRTTLTDNEALVRDFGVFQSPNKWSGREFNVAQRQHNDAHKTLEVFGVGGKYLGHRSDITILDDIVTEENSWTSDQRDKLRARYETAIQTGPQYMWPLRNPACKWEESSANLKVPEGIYWPKDINYERIVVSGTRFHPLDLYRKLAGDHRGRGGDKTFSAITFDCWTDGKETKPLWPSVWTAEKLRSEKESLGTLSFNKRYRNIAVDESELAFRQEWVFGGERDGEVFRGCVNENRSWGDVPDGLNLIVGFDPASGSTTRYATFPSFVLIGYDPDAKPEERKRFLIDLFRKQTGFDELIDVLLDGRPAKGIPGWRAKYHYQTAVIEKNGYGTMFINNDRIRRATESGLRVIPHWTGSNKLDPVDGVFTMQGIFKQGLVDIPYKTESDKKLAEQFLDQVLMFPKGINDWLMSTWFVELQLRKRFASGAVHHYTPGRRFEQSYWHRADESAR